MPHLKSSRPSEMSKLFCIVFSKLWSGPLRKIKFYDGRHQRLKRASNWYIAIPRLVLVRQSLSEHCKAKQKSISWRPWQQITYVLHSWQQITYVLHSWRQIMYVLHLRTLQLLWRNRNQEKSRKMLHKQLIPVHGRVQRNLQYSKQGKTNVFHASKYS